MIKRVDEGTPGQSHGPSVTVQIASAHLWTAHPRDRQHLLAGINADHAAFEPPHAEDMGEPLG